MAPGNKPAGSDSLNFYLGLDIGSVSLNTVILDDDFNIIEDYYDYVHGRPFHVLANRLGSLFNEHPGLSIIGAAITGTGGKLARELIGGVFVN